MPPPDTVGRDQIIDILEHRMNGVHMLRAAGGFRTYQSPVGETFFFDLGKWDTPWNEVEVTLSRAGIDPQEFLRHYDEHYRV